MGTAAATIGAVDVHYDADWPARAALAVCHDLTLSRVVAEHTADIAHPAPYEPGALYKRELPCIRAVLALGPRLDLLIVDGYATLDPQGRPGLGAHAADALGIPVIGVAKTPFRGATHAAEVIRGTSTRPLYVTTAGGLAIADAARIVVDLAGANRIPTALARVDNLARGRVLPSNDLLTT
ncbi:MAG: endonuclease V [Actinobacteria bacterium]|nr:endonuclease V [Actinomycetota bacterium]